MEDRTKKGVERNPLPPPSLNTEKKKSPFLLDPTLNLRVEIVERGRGGKRTVKEKETICVLLFGSTFQQTFYADFSLERSEDVSFCVPLFFVVRKTVPYSSFFPLRSTQPSPKTSPPFLFWAILQ